MVGGAVLALYFKLQPSSLAAGRVINWQSLIISLKSGKKTWRRRKNRKKSVCVSWRRALLPLRLLRASHRPPCPCRTAEKPPNESNSTTFLRRGSIAGTFRGNCRRNSIHTISSLEQTPYNRGLRLSLAGRAPSPYSTRSTYAGETAEARSTPGYPRRAEA